MCGIVGECALAGGAAELERVQRRNALIRHRGPDGSGHYVDPQHRCALAMRRLAIVDLTSGDQPISNEDGSVWVVFNGEIYNHAALRAELVSLGHRFRSDHSDTEVIVHGYETWGLDVLGHLRGMFALALWDERGRRLLLARDRLGKKPLYYGRVGSRLIFGSELRTLLADDAISTTIDPIALDHYLMLQFVPAPRTIVAGVQRLPAGHRLVVADGQITVEPYWRPPQRADREITVDAATDELDGLLTEAVDLRMEADVPVGALLSGGLDSSLAVALAQHKTHRPLHTFSVGFREAQFDESAFAAQVAQAIGSYHTPVTLDEMDESLLDRVTASLDEPLGDPAAVPTFVVSEVARRAVKVVLTGEGGDEAFGGYDTYRREQALAALLRVPVGLRSLATAPLAAVEPSSLRAQRILGILRADRAGWHTAFVTRIHRPTRWDLYGDALRRRLPAANGSGYLDGRGDIASGDPIENAALEDLARSLPDGLLMKVDKMTMAHSLEARTPYLDHRVIEWATRLPGPLRTSAESGKLVLKRVAERYLPTEIVHRRKHPFDVPIGRWLRGTLSGPFDDACATLTGRGFSSAGLDRLRAKLVGGDVRADLPAWLLLVLGRWLAMHPEIRL